MFFIHDYGLFHLISNKMIFGDYKLLKQIGVGGNSTVYMGKHKLVDFPLAIKVIKKDQSVSKYINQEIELCRELSHPNIITLFDIVELDTKLAIVMELATNGTIYTAMPFSSQKALFTYFSRICEAIRYLHEEKHIVHRDIKIENILLDKHHNVKLVDFGLSKKMETCLKTRCGSPIYSSPELIMSQDYNEKTDIWSLGVLLYYMIYERFPFKSDNIQILFQQITTSDVYFPKPEEINVNFDVSESLKDLILHMLDKNQVTRYSIRDVMSHPWYLKMKEGMNSALNAVSTIHTSHTHMTLGSTMPSLSSCSLTHTPKLEDASADDLKLLQSVDPSQRAVIQRILQVRRENSKPKDSAPKLITYSLSLQLQRKTVGQGININQSILNNMANQNNRRRSVLKNILMKNKK